MQGGKSGARTCHVALGERSYDIHIEPGCLKLLGRAMRELFPVSVKCLVVSNVTVAPLYMEKIVRGLEENGWQVATHAMPDGERYKTLASLEEILDVLMTCRLSRVDPVIALGGGVVGDITGFAAACYRRGIPYVQVPTTLLAQVDSSVGGKTAVNHPHGKNMIGAFYQPRLVWIDPEVLKTLPGRELRAGMAEVIKYGLIRDAGFFDFLEANMDRLLALDPDTLSHAIHTSCQCKARVVVRDETEQGERALLNLGHTFGHAIEAMTRYTQYLHGEAVAIGTLMAARLSARRGVAPAYIETRIRRLYVGAGLPVEVPAFSADDWLDTMGHDKKNIGTHIRYVLLRDIGDAFVAGDVTDADIRSLMDSYA